MARAEVSFFPNWMTSKAPPLQKLLDKVTNLLIIFITSCLLCERVGSWRLIRGMHINLISCVFRGEGGSLHFSTISFYNLYGSFDRIMYSKESATIHEKNGTHPPLYFA